jgi:hypothetical protein
MNRTNIYLSLIILGLLGFIGYQQRKISNQDVKITDLVHQKDLGNGVTRSGVRIGTADDVDGFAADAGVSMATVKEDAEKHGAVVTGVNVVEGTTHGTVASGVSSSRTKKWTIPTEQPSGSQASKEPPKPAGTESNEKEVCKKCSDCGSSKSEVSHEEQILDLVEKVGEKEINVGEVSFKSWELKPWSYSLFPRTFKSATVIAEDDDGNKLAYNHLEISVNGTSFELPVTTSTLVETPKPAKFRWFPRLNLGVGAGMTKSIDPEFKAGVSLSLANYGSMKLLPDWQFIGVGVNYSVQDLVSFSITPAYYRIGKHLPLVENLYFGLDLSIGLSANMAFTGSLSCAL